VTTYAILLQGKEDLDRFSIFGKSRLSLFPIRCFATFQPTAAVGIASTSSSFAFNIAIA
jgi:hypothetical protein